MVGVGSVVIGRDRGAQVDDGAETIIVAAGVGG